MGSEEARRGWGEFANGGGFVGVVDKVAASLGPLYNFFFELDRKTRGRTRLPVPVVSVGNIAMGGRAKTPLVIWLCMALKEKGWEPVVLTRGYKRHYKEPVWLLPSKASLAPTLFRTRARARTQLSLATSDWSGDEALEIFLRAQVPVLVGPKRVKNAKLFLAEGEFQTQRLVFVLDDGFQHWSLLRDYDLVVVSPEDLESAVFPSGPLRESPIGLGRSDRVLKLGEDLVKKTILPSSLAKSEYEGQDLILLSGRAPDPSYRIQFEKLLGARFRIQECLLRDHASPREMLQAIQRFSPKTHFAVGYKEAVKLVDPMDLLQGVDSFKLPTGHHLHVLGLNLELKDEALVLSEILRKLDLFR